MIEYQKVLDKHILNVFKDIIKQIKVNGLSNNNHLYVTFLTNHKKTKIPDWIKEKYPQEMTIVIQYEFYDIFINENSFSITLSFNDIKANLEIGYESIISFADPSANFGLLLKQNKIKKQVKKITTDDNLKEDNIVNFSNYKKK